MSVDDVELAIPVWKRALDLTVIVLAVPVWLPLGLACSAWIKLVSRGPILFQQERVGLHGKIFTIFKFRSMRIGAVTEIHEEHVDSVFDRGPMTKMDASDTRLIPGGRFLRAVGLDEIPQLLNVLRGEMSMVGPRPCIRHELSKFRGSKRGRFGVLPGLTGHWQIRGKNKTTFRRMAALDVTYARNASLGFDLKILALTAPALIRQVIEMRSDAQTQESINL